MTFKELQKLIHYRQSESNSNQTRFFDRLKDKPFWIWDIAAHKSEDKKTKGSCCSTHILGPPLKGEKMMPIFDYEMNILNLLTLKGVKRLWIKKATGLGISEFFLRYIIFYALKTMPCRTNASAL